MKRKKKAVPRARASTTEDVSKRRLGITSVYANQVSLARHVQEHTTSVYKIHVRMPEHVLSLWEGTDMSAGVPPASKESIVKKGALVKQTLVNMAERALKQKVDSSVCVKKDIVVKRVQYVTAVNQTFAGMVPSVLSMTAALSVSVHQDTKAPSVMKRITVGRILANMEETVLKLKTASNVTVRPNIKERAVKI